MRDLSIDLDFLTATASCSIDEVDNDIVIADIVIAGNGWEHVIRAGDPLFAKLEPQLRAIHADEIDDMRRAVPAELGYGHLQWELV